MEWTPDSNELSLCPGSQALGCAPRLHPQTTGPSRSCPTWQSLAGPAQWTHPAQACQQFCRPAGSICPWDWLVASLPREQPYATPVTCVPSPMDGIMEEVNLSKQVCEPQPASLQNHRKSPGPSVIKEHRAVLDPAFAIHLQCVLEEIRWLFMSLINKGQSKLDWKF